MEGVTKKQKQKTTQQQSEDGEMNLGFPNGEFWKPMGTILDKSSGRFLQTPSICLFLEDDAGIFAQVSLLHWLAPTEAKFHQPHGYAHSSFQMDPCGITEIPASPHPY